VPAVLHGCFDGSRLKSLPVALSRPYPAARHPLYRAVTLFVAPSRRAAGVLSQLADIDEDRIRVVPAFVEDVGVPPSRAPAGWLFVGQLEPTKGIEELVRHWPRKERLTIVGTGSLQADLLRAVQGSHIDVVGGRSRREVRRMMADSIGLVFPSAYLETQGLVVGEAASVGCPVVALTGTAGADQVTEHGFGVVLDSLEELDPALSAVATNRDALSSAAMTYWREELTEDVWVTRVQSIYSSLAVG
jgi:glycosyltransferase involved in cell wall biosynthesis